MGFGSLRQISRAGSFSSPLGPTLLSMSLSNDSEKRGGSKVKGSHTSDVGSLFFLACSLAG